MTWFAATLLRYLVFGLVPVHNRRYKRVCGFYRRSCVEFGHHCLGSIAPGICLCAVSTGNGITIIASVKG